jgi:hypothetical protein
MFEKIKSKINFLLQDIYGQIGLKNEKSNPSD